MNDERFSISIASDLSVPGFVFIPSMFLVVVLKRKAEIFLPIPTSSSRRGTRRKNRRRRRGYKMSAGVLQKPEHLDMGYQKMSQVELEMLTDRLLRPPKLSAADRHAHRRKMKFVRDPSPDWVYDAVNAQRPMTTKERSDVTDRISRPITRSKSSVTRIHVQEPESRDSSDVSSSKTSATPFKGTKPMTADELNQSIMRLSSSHTSRAKTAATTRSFYSGFTRGPVLSNGDPEGDDESRIMNLGQQNLNSRQISDMVLRLTTPKSRPHMQPLNIRRVKQKPLSAIEIASITDRLNKAEASVDGRRIYTPSQRRFGIVNSFLWKGWN